MSQWSPTSAFTPVHSESQTATGCAQGSKTDAGTPRLTDRICDLAYRYRVWLLIFVAGAYLAGFNGQWRVEPDAALYMTIGRNLAEGRGYTYLGQANHLAYPGLPWIIAGTFKLFGVNRIWPLDLVMLLVTFATLALVYRLFLLHAGPKTAVFITIGVAITKTFYRYAYEIRSDMPFLFGVMAFLCGYEAIFARHPIAPGQPRREPKWYDWALLIGGLGFATVMRPTIWVLLLALVFSVSLAILRGRVRWQAILLWVAVIGITILAFYVLDPRRAGSGTDDYETFAIHALTSNWRATLHHIIHVNIHEALFVATPDSIMQVRLGPFNLVLSVVFIAIGIALVRIHPLWGIFIGLIVAMNLVFLALDRYYLPVIPLLVYAWWLAVCKLDQWLTPRLARRWAWCIVLGLLGLGIISNLQKIGGIILGQHAKPFLAYFDEGEFQAMPELASQIHDKVSESSLVLIGHANSHAYGRIATFLSRRYVADRRDYSTLKLQGHTIYVIQPTDPATDDLLARNHLAIGPELSHAVRPHGRAPWSLHATIPK